MPKLSVGEKMPQFTYDTPFAAGVSLTKTAGRINGKTALVFLRYYGCTLCQYDIHQFAVRYNSIRTAGGQILVVLQSDPVKLADQLQPQDLPFDIICDPEHKLYREFGIEPAVSMAKMADAKTIAKIAKAKAGGFKHGEYEGEELQLPAVFVMEPDLTLTFVHYGEAAGDIPEAEELAKLLA